MLGKRKRCRVKTLLGGDAEQPPPLITDFPGDITVDGWTVGLPSDKETNDVNIYAYSGKIMIQAGSEWIGAELRIVNIMGQELYHDKYLRNMAVDIQTLTSSGLYIVTLNSGDKAISKKVMIR